MRFRIFSYAGQSSSRALASGVVRVGGADVTELTIDGSFTVSGPLETFANAGGVHVARALLAAFSANMAKLLAERRPAAAPLAASAATETAPAPPPRQPPPPRVAAELSGGRLLWQAFLSWLRSLGGKREKQR